ncbi:hypothetical protein P691DRAFT_689561, partial [Macrolepiota fuliginosa MF-IS2]
LKKLHEASMPYAFYDSDVRVPPPACHPGTRRDFIDKISDWGSDTSQDTKRMFWMYGPGGLGKQL